jgi:hypothetical protein
MSVSPCLSSCSSDHYCPSGAALRADKARPPAIDLAAACPRGRSAVFSLVDFRPAGIFRRQIAAWCGLGGEFTRALRREPFEVGYNGAWHLLIAYESAQRSMARRSSTAYPAQRCGTSPASSSSFRQAWGFASGRNRTAS